MGLPGRIAVDGRDAESDLTLPTVVTAFTATSRVAGVIPLLAGLLALMGWWQDTPLFTRVIAGSTSMNPASAVAFIFLGAALSLAAWAPPSTAARRAWTVLALIAVTIGLSKILGLGLGLDTQLDQLLFRAKLLTADGGLPNRMAPNTATNFVLLGSAIALLDRRIGRVHWPFQWLTVIAAMTALLAMTGYLYGISAFYGIGSQVAMALPSAVTFLIVAIGVLCARPTHGVMAVLSSRTSGGVMVRRLLPAVVIVPAALGFIRLGGEGALRFDSPIGLWLLVVAIMTVFTVLIAWNAKLLFRSDIERAAAERTLAHQATHDPLTHLPNRRLLIDRLERELAQSHESGVPVALLFVDLDLFKVINDSLGHAFGDELLIAAGARIRECVQEADVVARLSGDEFTVVLIGEPTRERATAVAEQIVREFSRSFTLGSHEIFTSVSIGIAFSDSRDTPVNLIRHGDMAMYRAKARGKGRFEIFQPAMDKAAMQRLELEIELRRAIENGELRVYYQPEVEIESGRLVGMEALVRWQHPQRGLISPSEFMPLAEETGLVVPIGKWVMHEACRQVKEWQETYHRDIALLVSVNLSGQHLQQATLISDVSEMFRQTGIDPAHLIIEVTETVAMAGAETTIEILSRLKSLGVRLAIDDFGTGFSSFAYLKRFPFDMLKIDKSFVDGVARGGNDASIVQAVITLSHALGLMVIAEGVETPAQLAELRSLGSELGQGYYFSRPMSDHVTDGLPSLLVDRPRWMSDYLNSPSS